MKKMINTTHIEGQLYEHKLELKTTGERSKNPGTQYISGTIDIATDDAGLNIVPVHFSYVTAVTSTGKANATFATLFNIVNGVLPSVVEHGKDKAIFLKIDSAIALNEFYTDRNGKEELVSAKRNEGGFVHVVPTINPDENERNTFTCDMVITNCFRKEADPAKDIPEKVIVKGAVFDFRGSLLPIELSVVNSAGMDYFEDLGASSREPVFTKVWGHQLSSTVMQTKTEESAFGSARVITTPVTRKDWIISGANTIPYEFDLDETLTIAELNEAVAKREVDLAAMKARQEEYKASRAAAAVAPVVTNTATDFRF